MTKFESLSDQLFVELFRYFHATELYQIFSCLNIRFDRILDSLTNLQLTLENDDQIQLVQRVSSRVFTLITVGEINVCFDQFENLRRLILRRPSKTFVEQLEYCHLPNLQYLLIDEIFFNISSIYQKLFSNGFCQLKSCYLFGFETIETVRPWSQTASLCRVHLALIDFYVYKSILSSCPNLFFLKFKLFQSYLKLSSIDKHENLKILQIESDLVDWRYNDQLIDTFLSAVPKLERLTIDRTMSTATLIELMSDYDWFSSIIVNRLPSLRYFQFHLHFDYHLEFLGWIHMETRRHLRKIILQAHQHHYQTRFTIR